ncbi:nuclear transport factor 2 family protein [Sphaerimonospora sp. CA-214678]|uniref:nuclear transport factor 2 family protein n=1 Tax=Sphaerimonospora sp. CA-214678 TaxID=3240029 RepID=UPI003D8F26C8
MEAGSVSVLDLDARRWNALVENDIDLLDELFADDLSYVHSNGMRDSKESYLGALREGVFRYLDVDVPAVEERRFGDTAVITGDAVATTRSAAGELVISIRYTAVWSLLDGKWRFVAWHSCPTSS